MLYFYHSVSEAITLNTESIVRSIGYQHDANYLPATVCEGWSIIWPLFSFSRILRPLRHQSLQLVSWHVRKSCHFLINEKFFRVMAEVTARERPSEVLMIIMWTLPPNEGVWPAPVATWVATYQMNKLCMHFWQWPVQSSDCRRPWLGLVWGNLFKR